MNSSPAMQTPPRELEIDTVAQFDARTKISGAPMSGWHCQSLDLRDRGRALERADVSGAVFLGCDLPPGSIPALRGRGALIFPDLPGLPFDPYRGGLYRAQDLYAGLGENAYEDTPDARIYAWSRSRGAGRGGLNMALATTLHDHAIGTALELLLRPEHDGDAAGLIPGRGVVGVMGGHAAERGTQAFSDAASLGRSLSGAQPRPGRVHRRHRGRPRSHGSSQPGRLPLRGGGGRPGGSHRAARRRAVVPSLDLAVGAGRARRHRRVSGRNTDRGDSDLVLRA
ncbi:hypothetical protein [Arthrobacter rhombi]|uniref:hypothetical protein n=1 Tax=Arthrobacter rhombi TaxID=71253 RepID=UPI003FD2C55E